MAEKPEWLTEIQDKLNEANDGDGVTVRLPRFKINFLKSDPNRPTKKLDIAVLLCAGAGLVALVTMALL